MAIDVFQRVSFVRSARGARTARLIAAAGTVVLCVQLAIVAVAGAGLLSDDASDSPILFQLFAGPVPAPIAMLVISGFGLLATSIIIVGQLPPRTRRTPRVSVLRASQLAMIPVAAIGILVALRFYQP